MVLVAADTGVGLRGVVAAKDSAVVGGGRTASSQQTGHRDEDGVIRVWDTGSGRLLLTLPSSPDSLGVALSPDGRLVSGSGPDGFLRLWQVDDPASPMVLRGHRHFVRRTAFSADGRRLVSASDDGTRIVAGAQDGSVLLWSAETSGPPEVLRGHEGEVWDVTYSPDGRWVASTGSDKTVRFWPVGDGQTPVVLRWSGAMAPSVAYGRNAQRLVSAHADGTTRLWT